MSAAAAIGAPLPEPVAEAIARGWSLFPVNIHKEAYFPWKALQSQRATPGAISAWARRNPPAYSVITGRLSGIIILDFDGEDGAALMQKWNIRPHVRTGSGGHHWYIKHPGWYVKTLNSKSDKANLGKHYPGLDIRGDGGYAVMWTAAPLYGKTDPSTGAPDFQHAAVYEWLRPMDPDEPGDVPEHARQLLGLDAPPPSAPVAVPPPAARPPQAAGREDTATFLQRQLSAALTKASGGHGRNDCGASFCQQLRDAGLSQAEAEGYMRQYQASAPATNAKGQQAPYTWAEAERTIASIFSRPARGPARSQSAPRSQQSAPRPAPQPTPAPERPAATVEDNADPRPGRGRPPGKKPSECLRADAGNAERLILRYGKDIRYCHPIKSWLCWNGQRWNIDQDGAIMRLALDTAAQIHREIDDKPDERKEITAWFMKSHDSGRLAAMVNVAKNFESVAILPDQLDTDPYLFNCANGTIDLQTGELRKADRRDLITKLSPVAHNPDAAAPVFSQFVAQLMTGRADLIRYLQRSFGYSLTGRVTEKAVFILHGKGDNGKTTLLEAFRHVMGDYAMALRIESLMHAQSAAAGHQANPDIVKLRGCRFVSTSEAEDGQRLNEALIKLLTGMNRISARDLYKEQFEFDPSHKLFMDSNYRPRVRGQDKGIWTRLKMIPFDLHLGSGQKDRHLPDKLRAEAEGLLMWALYGCMKWQECGIEEPAEVRESTAAYRASMDTLGQFLEEACTVDPEAEQTARPLYKAFASWTRAAGEFVISEKNFAERLADRDGITRIRKGAGQFYKGLRLRWKVDEQGNITDTPS